jgi:hypothetical protein
MVISPTLDLSRAISLAARAQPAERMRRFGVDRHLLRR